MGTANQFARSIEEASLNAWPALTQILFDGWILRFAGGYSRRNNSVNAFYKGVMPDQKKIERSEEIYRSRQLRPVFKITPFIYPANLDSLLAQANYSKEAPTSVQLLDLAHFSLPRAMPKTQWSNKPDGEWTDAFAKMNQVPVHKQATLQAILDHIAPESCFMAVLNQNRLAGWVFYKRALWAFLILSPTRRIGEKVLAPACYLPCYIGQNSKMPNTLTCK